MADRAHGGQHNLDMDFSVNLNPLITIKELKSIVKPLLKSVIPYPETRAQSLLSVISSYFSIEKKHLIAGNGSIELLYYLPRVLDIKRIITFEPTFCEYRYLANINNLNHQPVFFKNCFQWDIEAVKRQLTARDLLIICNPNNPTGTLFSKNELLNLVYSNAFVLIDEAFMDFSDRDESLIKYVKTHPNLFILRSFTKIFSLAGLRIGILAGDEKVIRSMERLMPLWNVNGLAQELTKKLLNQKNIIERTKRYIKKERSFLVNKLKSFPLQIFDSAANFICLKSDRAEELVMFAKDRGVALRTSDGFLGLDRSYIRVAVKRRKDNQILIKIFEDFFRGE